MKDLIKKSACAAACAISIATSAGIALPPTAQAMTVYDPSNHAENLASKLQLIKSYEKQLQQFEAQLQQLAKLDPAQLSTSVQEVQEIVSEMNDIRTSINAIGTDFRTAEAKFDETFADFTKWNGAPAQAYADQAARVNAAVDDGIKQSILSQGLASPEEMQKTANSLSTLLAASQNAEGIVGVTQAATQIAALQVRETQRMQAIIADSMKGQNLYLKKMTQTDEAAAKRAEEFFQTDDIDDIANATYSQRD
ncbi:hypothetical protein, partial [Selenomonas sp.]|uniref:hypothetical protein n=1 Tax=Selenomonas sp. TaxID=2053611 RepID=UPI002A74CCBE